MRSLERSPARLQQVWLLLELKLEERPGIHSFCLCTEGVHRIGSSEVFVHGPEPVERLPEHAERSNTITPAPPAWDISSDG
jgi:hypothetical protein